MNRRQRRALASLEAAVVSVDIAPCRCGRPAARVVCLQVWQEPPVIAPGFAFACLACVDTIASELGALASELLH